MKFLKAFKLQSLEPSLHWYQILYSILRNSHSIRNIQTSFLFSPMWTRSSAQFRSKQCHQLRNILCARVESARERRTHKSELKRLAALSIIYTCSWRWNAKNVPPERKQTKTSQIANNHFNRFHSFALFFFSFFSASASSRSSPLSVNCEFKCSITREAKRWKTRRDTETEVSMMIKDLRLLSHLSARVTPI